MENEFGFEILGWCGYCKNEIYVGDNYIYIDGQMYHTECHQTMNNYYDPYNFGEEDENRN